MTEFALSAFADEIDTDLKKQMDVLEKHGIGYIEMRGVNGRNLVDHSLDEVREIKKELDARGFKISAIGSPIGKIKITDDFEAHLKLFRHTIEIAKILETQYIRIFSFFIPAGEDPSDYRDEVMGRLSDFISIAEENGLVLLHENEKEIYGDTAERCLDILDTMDSRKLKATFDPANFVQCKVETYPKAFNLLKEHIEYVHIKDAVYADGHVTPAGEGDGKVLETLIELYKSGYSGFLSIEPHLQDFVGFKDLEPNSKTSLEPAGPGEARFAAAVEALKKVLAEVKKEL